MAGLGPELAGGVGLHHPGDLIRLHAAPIVPHTQPRQALLLQPHLNVGGRRVQGILDELLDGAPDTGHHLAALQETDSVLGQRSQAALCHRIYYLDLEGQSCRVCGIKQNNHYLFKSVLYVKQF